MKLILEELHEKFGYPKEVKELDYVKHAALFDIKDVFGLVWDLDHGILLQVDDSKEVKSATWGFNKLKQTQIFSFYFFPPKFDAL